MSGALRKREQELLLRLQAIPVDSKEAKVTLLFTGDPVLGSMGVDAQFVGKALVPFQSMVRSDFAHRVHGKTGQRGPIRDEEQSRLYLTGLPRGSFGVELSKLNSADLFEEGELADSLSHIAKLVDSSAKSDEDFAAELDEVAPRTLQSLKDFLKVITEEKAGFVLESGGIRCDLTPSEARNAFDRVGGTQTSDRVVEQIGVLKGILLESWRFDFVDENGNAITGRIDETLTEANVSNYIHFFNKRCRATLNETLVVFKNGREKKNYVLQNVRSIDGQ
jgi:hypothetical protein